MLKWEMHNTFGWGIVGLNIFSHWARDPDLMPLAGAFIDNDAVRMVDPLRLSVISGAITNSNQYLEALLKCAWRAHQPGCYGHRSHRT